jgi:hypothetical protein
VNQRVDIHDYSLGEGNDRHASGTLTDVYNEHLKGGAGKILNVLVSSDASMTLSKKDSQPIVESSRSVVGGFDHSD